MVIEKRYSILICGSGGAGLHCAQVVEADGRGQVVGLCDPITKQLEKAVAKYPGAQTGDDYQRLLEETKPDVVVVAGPDHLHAEQAVTALDHGCHVLIEKPFATTIDDARDILDAEKRTGLHVMADHTYRYMFPEREMVLATKAGEIGDVFFVQGDYIHDMTEYYRPQGRSHTPWRADEENPQNILLGGGIHTIDLMLWAVEERVEEVFCYSNKKCAPEFPSDDCYLMVMRFANGILGKCHVTSGCSGPTWHRFFESYGDHGTLSDGKLFQRDTEPVALKKSTAVEVVGGHGWAESVTDFLDLLDGKTENPIPSRAGFNSIAICIAGLEAIKTGKPQRPEWI